MSPELVGVSGWVVYADSKSATGYLGVENLKLTWTLLGPASPPTTVLPRPFAGPWQLMMGADDKVFRTDLLVVKGLKPERHAFYQLADGTKGTLQGPVADTVWSGTWKETDTAGKSRSGSFRVSLMPDGRRFIGTFNNDTAVPSSSSDQRLAGRQLLPGAGLTPGKTYETVTGANGAYRIQVPAAEYSVHLHLSRAFKPRPDERVSVVAGMKPRFFTVEPAGPELVKVQGYVITESHGEPRQYVAVSSARVTWQRNRPPVLVQPVVAVTDEGGRFEVTLPEDVYDVSVDPPPGFQPAGAIIRVAKDMERPRFVVTRVPAPVEPVVPPHPIFPIPPVPHPHPHPEPVAGSFAGTWNVALYAKVTASGAPATTEHWVITVTGNRASTRDATGRTISGLLSGQGRTWNATGTMGGIVVQQFRNVTLSPDGNRFEGKWSGPLATPFRGYAIVGTRAGVSPVVGPTGPSHQVVQVQGIGKRTFPVTIARGGTVEVLINQSPANPMTASLVTHTRGLVLASQGEVAVPSKPGLIGGPTHKLQYKFTARESGRIVFQLSRPWEQQPTLTAEIEVTVVD